MKINLETLKAQIADEIRSTSSIDEYIALNIWNRVKIRFEGFEQELRELLKTKHTSHQFDIYKDRLIEEILGE